MGGRRAPLRSQHRNGEFRLHHDRRGSLHFKDITQSSSIIIVPLTTDAPPSNSQLQVNITGFLKLFITQIHPPNAKPNSAKNQIDALVIGVDHCAGSGPGGDNGNPNVTSTSGGIDILRLVR